MVKLYDPVLEYRRFIQCEHSADEKATMLAELAKKGGTTPESILYEFLRGDDLLDPSICDRESIEAFAKKNKITNDPQVLASIALARPRGAFQKL